MIKLSETSVKRLFIQRREIPTNKIPISDRNNASFLALSFISAVPLSSFPKFLKNCIFFSFLQTSSHFSSILKELSFALYASPGKKVNSCSLSESLCKNSSFSTLKNKPTTSVFAELKTHL